MRLGLSISIGVLGAAASDPENSAPAVIAVQGGGSPVPGAVLVGTPGTWSGSPVLTYQWRQDGVDIEGEGDPEGFTILEGTEGSEITLLEIPDGVVEDAVASNGITVVPQVPVNTNPPSLTADGSSVGSTVSYDGGDTWDGIVDTIYRQWYRDGGELAGETNDQVFAGDAGEYTLRLIAENAGGQSEPVFSAGYFISE